MIELIVVVAVILVFDLAALRWGADSRQRLDAEPPRKI